jgi:putative transposase
VAQEVDSRQFICGVLGVCRSAHYQWCDHGLSAREAETRRLTALVVSIFWRHKRRYGARRIAKELAGAGQVCSAKRVARILKTQGLRAMQPKSFVPKTTASRHRLGYSPNLLLDEPEPTAVDRLWVGDITYVRLEGGVFCYLAVLMDRYSRRIVGWELGKNMTEDLTLSSLRMAIRTRQPQPGLLHHTDRGGQYASAAYRAMLRRAAIRQSMSRADNCYDNAFAESCFGTLKRELEMTEYVSYDTARREIDEYIRYYNNERRHSSVDYHSPSTFENLSSQRK